MDTVESAVDYSYLWIGGISFLLPVRVESLGCEQGTSECRHNIIDFRNYHDPKVLVSHAKPEPDDIEIRNDRTERAGQPDSLWDTRAVEERSNAFQC